MHTRTHTHRHAAFLFVSADGKFSTRGTSERFSHHPSETQTRMLVLPSVQILDLKLLEGSFGGASWHSAYPHTHSTEGDALGECVDRGGGSAPVSPVAEMAPRPHHACAQLLSRHRPWWQSWKMIKDIEAPFHEKRTTTTSFLPAFKVEPWREKGRLSRVTSRKISREREKETENVGALLHFLFY